VSLFRTKSIDELISASEEPGKRLEKSLGPWSLTALGIGAVIGSGIFILTGTAAAGETLAVPSMFHAPVLDILMTGGNPVSTVGRPGAGPAIALSFLLVAFVCSFAALCFAELASMIPIAGSTYTYAYATLGELIAWIIGWDLILEYAVSNMAVAVGFSAYFNDMLDALFGWHLPQWLSEPAIVGGAFSGSVFNLPAFVVIMLLTVLLVRGVKESAKANNVMVLIKVAAILIFVGAAAGAVRTSNWVPFMPNGFAGVLTGGAIVFFTYIGFDSVSTAAEECRKPQRDLPFGIIMTLLVCTVLYVSVALVLTGVVNWKELNSAAPVAGIEGPRLRQRAKNRQRGRDHRHAVVAARLPVRSGSGVVRDVTRPSAARFLLQGASPLEDAAHFDMGGRLRCGAPRGRVGRRHVRRPVEHRDSVRLCGGVRGRDRGPTSGPAPAARLPRSFCAADSGIVDRVLPAADARTAAQDVAAVLRVADRWARVVLRLWTQARQRRTPGRLSSNAAGYGCLSRRAAIC
jgi:hypothetical protein